MTMQYSKYGARMKRHAEKPVFTGGPGEGSVDGVLRGVIEETYGSPACGNVEARRS
jgi:hypothetical protein